jgi:hypothetical protein
VAASAGFEVSNSPLPKARANASSCDEVGVQAQHVARTRCGATASRHLTLACAYIWIPKPKASQTQCLALSLIRRPVVVPSQLSVEATESSLTLPPAFADTNIEIGFVASRDANSLSG